MKYIYFAVNAFKKVIGSIDSKIDKIKVLINLGEEEEEDGVEMQKAGRPWAVEKQS